jgi:hypothetical protein
VFVLKPKDIQPIIHAGSASANAGRRSVGTIIVRFCIHSIAAPSFGTARPVFGPQSKSVLVVLCSHSALLHGFNL